VVIAEFRHVEWLRAVAGGVWSDSSEWQQWGRQAQWRIFGLDTSISCSAWYRDIETVGSVIVLILTMISYYNAWKVCLSVCHTPLASLCCTIVDPDHGVWVLSTCAPILPPIYPCGPPKGRGLSCQIAISVEVSAAWIASWCYLANWRAGFWIC